jgi:hypothetical protein
MTRTDSSNQDEETFYRKLLELLHPDGLVCPRCGSRHFNQVSSDFATSVPAYWCSDCTRCFDAWTGTLLQGACCPASEVYRELLCVLARVARRGLRNSGSNREDATSGPFTELIPDDFLRANSPGAEPGIEAK